MGEEEAVVSGRMAVLLLRRGQVGYVWCGGDGGACEAVNFVLLVVLLLFSVSRVFGVVLLLWPVLTDDSSARLFAC